MTFLANENFPLPSVRYLREAGFDIVSVGEISPGISDEAVMELAMSTDRTIITFDKDYGELIFRLGYRPGQGVIFLRLDHFEPSEPGEIILNLVANNLADLSRSFIVFDGENIRRRSY